jgi:glycosyltransferase involved in cell wall biosynthesis
MREAKKADVIYAQNAVAAGLPAVIAGVLLRKPVVIKFVGDEAWERATQHRATSQQLEAFLEKPDGTLRTRLMMTLQGFVLRHASRVTTPSEYLREVIVNTYGIKPERAVTNYNAADDHGTPMFAPVRVPHQLVMTARLTAWKGVDSALRALPHILAHYPDTTLTVAGDGPERESLEALTKELGLTNAVRFLGNVSRTETWQLRKESDVYILNSTYEGLPHTVLTSFAAGIPLVATNISGTNEAVIDGVNGLLIPPHNPKALADAVIRLFNDPSLQVKLVQGGTATLVSKFSWEAHLRALTALLSLPR